MIGETFTLIKLLFSSKPKEHKEVILMPMDHYPLSGYKFMSWCGMMIYRSKKQEVIDRYMSMELGKKSRRHENFHLKQAQHMKHPSWLSYYSRYVWEWIKGNPIIHPASSAYETIPFEVEAYALDDNEEALQNYNPKLLKEKYTLKNRKKLYKQVGAKNWKTYVKSL